jgi:hypothetical protein
MARISSRAVKATRPRGCVSGHASSYGLKSDSADRTREKAHTLRPSSRRRDGSRGRAIQPKKVADNNEEGTDGSRSACRHLRAACEINL